RTQVGSSDSHLTSLALQPNGKIVAAGEHRFPRGPLEYAVARYHENGATDFGFGARGYVVTKVGSGIENRYKFQPTEPKNVTVTHDGAILAVGQALSAQQN